MYSLRASAQPDLVGMGVRVLLRESLVERKGVPESTLAEGLRGLATDLFEERLSCTQLQSQSTAHRMHLLLDDSTSGPDYTSDLDESNSCHCRSVLGRFLRDHGVDRKHQQVQQGGGDHEDRVRPSCLLQFGDEVLMRPIEHAEFFPLASCSSIGIRAGTETEGSSVLEIDPGSGRCQSVNPRAVVLH
jgi:hypothetical protein